MKLPRRHVASLLGGREAHSTDRQMSALEDHFGDLASLIPERRKIDAELDEICSDFELLAADLREEGKASGHWRRELESSLAGLKKEILTKLQDSD